MTSLVIEVRSLTGVYHGRGDGDAPEWPPSPFRLFQAIVAGACSARWGDGAEARDRALAWLERQAPPDVHAPPAERRNGYTLYVPNNGIDARGGDPARVGELRVTKTLRPLAFDRRVPVLYHWRRLDSSVPDCLPSLVRRVHTLGLGIDPAFAEARLVPDEEAESIRNAPAAIVHRPGSRAEATGRAGAGSVLAVPVDGSLAALHERHAQFLDRLRPGSGRETLFVQARLPLSGRVLYGAPPASAVLELRDPAVPDRFAPLSPTRVEALVERIRESVAMRFPGREADIDRYVRGRTAGSGDIASRVRFVPLPSIGGEHADRLVRRVLVEVPQTCPVRLDAIRWALEGRELDGVDPGAGPIVLMAGDRNDPIVARYRPRGGARRWRTVTPVVLPRSARGPKHASGKARGQAADAAERALRQALRHAGIDARLLEADFRREPFERHGTPAPRHATGRRFGASESSRFTHVELSFDVPVTGPLLVGDGRYCGLGLFERVEGAPTDRWSLRLGSDIPASRRDELLRQLRRALMSQVRRVIGDDRPLPALVSGHAADGGPLKGKGGEHEHVYFRAEHDGDRVVGAEIFLPDAVNRVPRDHVARSHPHARFVDDAVSRLKRLRLGPDVVTVTNVKAPIAASGLRFATRVPYVSTRRPRAGQAREAFVENDLRTLLERSRLPRAADIRVSSASLRPDGLMAADVELRFDRVVSEPVLLGRTCHVGGGDFRVIGMNTVQAG